MKATGAKILIDCLVEQGVDTVFGYPGGAVLYIYDELFKQSDKIRHILTAHEQGAAHAADGYARSSGRPGVCLATSGPGATNLVTGIATAYMDSSPLIAITGNVSTPLLGKDSFQEVDIVGITMPITKHNFMVKDVTKLADTVRAAFEIATTGRPGPVLIDIPKDVTAALADWEPSPAPKASCLGIHCKTSAPSDADIEAAAALLAAARRPFIYAGGGVITANASAELVALAERLHAPVALSLMGHGAMPNAHPLFTGMIGMHGTRTSNQAVGKADVLIAMGARFSDRVVSNVAEFAKDAHILHIDIDPAEIDKNVFTSSSLVGDLKGVLTRLLARIPQKAASDWNGDIEAWKKDRPSSHTRKADLHPRFVIETVQEKIGGEAIVTTEVGQHQMWVCQFYPFSRPREFITSGGLGTMGFGTGAAMGSQMANPGRRVVHFAGDGSFRMNCNELATITNYGLPIIIVILNNRTLGMVRQWQKTFYASRYAETDLDRPPDFVKLADAYGIPGFSARTEAEFTAAFDAALASGGAAVIDCVIDINENVLPMVPSGASIAKQIFEDPEEWGRD